MPGPNLLRRVVFAGRSTEGTPSEPPPPPPPQEIGTGEKWSIMYFGAPGAGAPIEGVVTLGDQAMMLGLYSGHV